MAGVIIIPESILWHLPEEESAVDRFMGPVTHVGLNRALMPVPRLISMPPSIPQWALTIVQSCTINWGAPCGFVMASPCRCSDRLAGGQVIFIPPVPGREENLS